MLVRARGLVLPTRQFIVLVLRSCKIRLGLVNAARTIIVALGVSWRTARAVLILLTIGTDRLTRMMLGCRLTIACIFLCLLAVEFMILTLLNVLMSKCSFLIMMRRLLISIIPTTVILIV